MDVPYAIHNRVNRWRSREKDIEATFQRQRTGVMRVPSEGAFGGTANPPKFAVPKHTCPFARGFARSAGARDGSRRRGRRPSAEAREHARDGRFFCDDGAHLESSAAAGASFHIDLEGSRQKQRPLRPRE